MNMTATAPTSTATITELTFIYRSAPARSIHAGQVMAELRTTSLNVHILSMLQGLGLWHPTALCDINVTERYVDRTKQYKILRFTASPETLRLLHKLCSPATREDIALETEARMAMLSINTATEALIADYDKATLKSMAEAIDIGYKLVTGKNPTKKKLAEFITSHAQYVEQELVAA